MTVTPLPGFHLPRRRRSGTAGHLVVLADRRRRVEESRRPPPSASSPGSAGWRSGGSGVRRPGGRAGRSGLRRPVPGGRTQPASRSQQAASRRRPGRAGISGRSCPSGRRPSAHRTAPDRGGSARGLRCATRAAGQGEDEQRARTRLRHDLQCARCSAASSAAIDRPSPLPPRVRRPGRDPPARTGRRHVAPAPDPSPAPDRAPRRPAALVAEPPPSHRPAARAVLQRVGHQVPDDPRQAPPIAERPLRRAATLRADRRLRSARSAPSEASTAATSADRSSSSRSRSHRAGVDPADLQQVRQQRLEPVHLRPTATRSPDPCRRRRGRAGRAAHRWPSGSWSAGCATRGETSETNRCWTRDRSSSSSDLHLQAIGHAR